MELQPRHYQQAGRYFPGIYTVVVDERALSQPSLKMSRVTRTNTNSLFRWILRHYIGDNNTCADMFASTACWGVWLAAFSSTGAHSSSYCDASAQRCVRCLLERSARCAV